MPSSQQSRRRHRRQKSRQTKPPSFRQLLKTLPRPHPHPHLEWHLQLYDQLTKLKRHLERYWRTPLLSEEQLKELGVTLGAELNIDEKQPFDVEPRFFVPSSSRIASLCTQRFVKGGKKWPKPDDPCDWDVDSAGNRYPEVLRIDKFSLVLWNITGLLEIRSKYGSNPYWKRNTSADCADPTRTTCYGIHRIGRHEVQEYHKTISMVHKEASGHSPDSTISHALLITCDTIEPDERLLRSELLLAACMLRTNLALQSWPGHHTFPTLVFSFHETGARILQIHADREQIFVRRSRKLNFLSTGGIPADGLTMIKWMLARPIGDTAFADILLNADAAETEKYRGEYDPGVTSTLAMQTATETRTNIPQHVIGN